MSDEQKDIDDHYVTIPNVPTNPPQIPDVPPVVQINLPPEQKNNANMLFIADLGSALLPWGFLITAVFSESRGNDVTACSFAAFSWLTQLGWSYNSRMRHCFKLGVTTLQTLGVFMTVAPIVTKCFFSDANSSIEETSFNSSFLQ